MKMRVTKMIYLIFILGSLNSCKKNEIKKELLEEVKTNLPDYKIAYGDTKKIWMMDSDGTNSIELTDAGPISGYVCWSPDAEYVYYASAKGPKETAWEAWRVNVKTKEAIQLSDFGRDVRSIAISPDNKYVAISLMTGNSNIGNNNNNLTQFNTDLYIVEMTTLESVITSGNKLKEEDLNILVSSPPTDQFWYEELNWNPVLPDDGIPVLAYTKTWRYDEDKVSYTHAYTIKADGSNNQLIKENEDMPLWDFTGTKLVFLSGNVYDFNNNSSDKIKVKGIRKEVSGLSISPDGKYVLFEIGDLNRKGGLARYSITEAQNGVQLDAKNVYEPRWSPVPIE